MDAPGAKNKLYFIGLLPPPAIAEQVTGFKKEFAEKYNSSHGLHTPAHITLQMPFCWAPDREEFLVTKLRSFSEKQFPFHLYLSGFGTFSPHTIFIAVKENRHLRELQQELVEFLQKELDLTGKAIDERGFHPHMTLAFRDLEKHQFDIAWNVFRKRQYEADFPVNQLCLLKHLNKRWTVLDCFPFR